VDGGIVCEEYINATGCLNTLFWVTSFWTLLFVWYFKEHNVLETDPLF
jgi:hypothetical protein